MKSLEDTIGYKFRNSLLLAEALTHPSLAYETQKPHFDNQRLEFLGDAVLQLVLTDDLFARFVTRKEGDLTKLRARLVSRPALAAYARRIGIGEYLMMGKGEEASGGRDRESTLADAFEALIGAIYVDSGLPQARSFILRICAQDVTRAARKPDETNPKGRLQELLQAVSAESPAYSIIAQNGPDHQKTFEAKVEWMQLCLGRGAGTSKKDAEIEAARAALESEFIVSLSENAPLGVADIPRPAETPRHDGL